MITQRPMSYWTWEFGYNGKLVLSVVKCYRNVRRAVEYLTLVQDDIFEHQKKHAAEQLKDIRVWHIYGAECFKNLCQMIAHCVCYAFIHHFSIKLSANEMTLIHHRIKG